MKRREFLTSTAAVLGGTVIGPNFGPGLSSAIGVSEARADVAPKKGGTLIWGHSETTQNLDIHKTGTASTGRVLQNVHCSIVTVDKDFKVIPNLAESFEVAKDGLSYTFHLRKDVVFHNGAKMTSADVKYSFERCKNPKTGAVNKPVFNAVSSIETPDDYTVIVKMSKVNAPFLARVAEIGAGVVIPKESGPEQGTHPIGCGPFEFVKRDFGQKVVLKRFDKFWGGPVYLDGVEAREITEPTVRLTGLQTGELHMIDNVPPDRMPQVEKDPKLSVYKWFPLNFDFVNFNHKFEPFKNPNVRKAFDYMIDKEALLQGALWGNGHLTASPSFPSSASFNHKLTQRKQDIAKAREMLAKEGYGPGKLELTFKVTTNYPYHVQSAQIMLEWFQAAGVKVKIEQLTWADWLSQCWVNKDFQITMMNFFTLWEPDFLYYSLWNSQGAFNYRNINDPLIDKLTEEARTEIDRPKRMEIYKQVQDEIHDKTHDVILWFRNGSIGSQKGKVMGVDTIVEPDGSNFDFQKVWLNT